ncbi:MULTISPECIES: hypothetical protein [Cyanophyceae]|uniref:hypothetical protein n=1 Tax=Cyanophyceae TaxID=3028117 RepID=UPI0013565A70|nr:MULTISPECIES: hypothetical protein [Cyanophyceae]NQZ65170.1 hypothetical protein [Crocosphaera sp.]
MVARQTEENFLTKLSTEEEAKIVGGFGYGRRYRRRYYGCRGGYGGYRGGYRGGYY